MNHEQDKLDETIRRAVGNETVTFDAVGWMNKHPEEVAILKSRKPAATARVEGVSPSRLAGILSASGNEGDWTYHNDQANGTHNAGETPAPCPATWRTWRTIMHTRTLKIAASAAAVIAIAAVAVLWPAGGGSTIALAAVLEQLQAKSYEFVVEYPDPRIQPQKCTVLEPGKYWTETPDGRYIVNYQSKQMLLLSEPHKTALQRDLDEDWDMVGFLGRPMDDLWGLQTGQETRLDPQTIDGQDAQGFRVVMRKNDAIHRVETVTVWANAKTAAPLRVDVARTWTDPNDGKEHTFYFTLRDFKAIPKPDPAQFSTEVPEGYSLGFPPGVALRAPATIIALPAVLEQLQSQSYEFTLEWCGDEEMMEDNAGSTVKGMVLEPGKLRLEQNGGTGPIISIFDHDAKRSLLLWVNFKAGYRFDKPEDNPVEEELNILGFLLRPDRSINDLWRLQAGTETRLDPKQIDGRDVQGFHVTQKSDAYTQTITVWADAKTATPVQVDVMLQPNKDDDQEHRLGFTLRDFKVVPNLDPALFSTDPPAGYTLANQMTLEQLLAEPATDTEERTSAEAEKILSALELWRGGHQRQAVETLAAVDWTADIHFGREHYVFTITESRYVSLVTADQEKVMETITPQLSTWREIARNGLVDQAAQARQAGNDAQAEKYLLAADGLGHYLNRNKDIGLIIRMVGIAIQRRALNELAPLYESQGENGKLRDVRRKLQDIDEQQEEVKRIAAGEVVDDTSAEAKKLLSVMESWRGGNKQQAVESLTAVDWNASFRFGREQLMFTMTESQYVSLVTDDQEKVMPEVLSQTREWAEVGRELVDLAAKARNAGNNAQAESYLNTAIGLGRLLNDKNKLVVVQMAGVLIEYRSLKELSSLYEAQSETTTLQNVQRRMKELEQSEYVKKPAAGEQ